ncbi:MAG: MBL fold metallo-hydrolase [Gemmatimonadetes bacterium]|nr:MBL fold metallo-hydrolase [Gemmatimonadota bacterium]
MRLTFLGTGTSYGIPVVGCGCATCTSDDVRDRRTRHGALLETAGGRLLVDTPPELRLQLVREGVTSVDALWITHVHADHLHGIDDVRVFSARQGRPLPAYAPEVHLDDLMRRFDYVFDPSIQPPEGSTKPDVTLHGLREGEPVEIVGETFVPLLVPHGSMSVFGFRVGSLGYVTDGKRLPPRSMEALRGVRVLVLNALWFGNPHPTHFNMEEAVEAAAAVGAERTFLVHMTHRVRHSDLLERLPSGVEPAYDGLTIDLDDA